MFNERRTFRPLLRHWDNLNRNLTAISISIKRWMGDIWCMWFSFKDFSYKFPASPELIYLHLAIIWKDKQILLGEILVSLSLYTVIEPSWGKCAIIGGGRVDRRTHRGDICYTFNTGSSSSEGHWGMLHLTNFTRLQVDKNSSHPSLVENCFNWQAFVCAQCALLGLTTEFPLLPRLIRVSLYLRVCCPHGQCHDAGATCAGQVPRGAPPFTLISSSNVSPGPGIVNTFIWRPKPWQERGMMAEWWMAQWARDVMHNNGADPGPQQITGALVMVSCRGAGSLMCCIASSRA